MNIPVQKSPEHKVQPLAYTATKLKKHCARPGFSAVHDKVGQNIKPCRPAYREWKQRLQPRRQTATQKPAENWWRSKSRLSPAWPSSGLRPSARSRNLCPAITQTDQTRPTTWPAKRPGRRSPTGPSLTSQPTRLRHSAWRLTESIYRRWVQQAILWCGA